VSETVIAAVLLLHERSVEDIAPVLSPDEREQTIVLVGRSPMLYPLGKPLRARAPCRRRNRQAEGRCQRRGRGAYQRPSWAPGQFLSSAILTATDLRSSTTMHSSFRQQPADPSH
jgi:hypothetical protein